MQGMIDQKEYFYHCEISEEHLITGCQEEMMKASNQEEMKWINNSNCGPDDEEPEGWSDLRWYAKGSTSFAEKDFDKFIEHVKRDVLLKTKGSHIIQHEGNKVYILYENCHWWIKEVILTRLHIYIYRHAIIEQKDGFVENLLKEVANVTQNNTARA
jgi:hypothetical protein